MENQTFRSRLVDLIQKSRKAMRLYTSMGRTFVRPGETRAGSEYADAQASEWRGINAELVRKLSSLVEGPQNRKIIAEVLALRDQLYSDFRMAEADLRSKQQELVLSAENSDFIKAALLSRELVVLKARAQATQAAHHELDSVIKKSKIQVTHHGEISYKGESGEYEEGESSVQVRLAAHTYEAAPSYNPSCEEVQPAVALAKVIPLRKAAP